ncbi:MAG: uridine kinase [Pirellulales bacterium]|jgi:uridine kinase|nr:uridine kinase [Pirellulales bacterium]MDA0817882.1 uridine kinase [Planctomycetota bacterium]
MPHVHTIIGIAGASGAGKSRLARQLNDRLRATRSSSDVAIVNEDSYYRRRDDLPFADREKINYDHPAAIEHELLVEHLAALRRGEAVEVPRYDYGQHNRHAETDRLEPSKVLILEGILILHIPELRELLDLKLYVDVPMDICLARRLRRDMVERDRSLDSVLQQYDTTVRPMFFQFIEPSKQHADLIIPHGGENRSALHVLLNHLDRQLT